MTATPAQDPLDPLAVAAADGASATQRALDGLSRRAASVRTQAGTAIGDLASGAGDLAREGARELRRYSLDARDGLADRIRERPLQAVLVAAGTGAAIALLARALFSAGRRER